MAALSLSGCAFGSLTDLLQCAGHEWCEVLENEDTVGGCESGAAVSAKQAASVGSSSSVFLGNFSRKSLWFSLQVVKCFTAVRIRIVHNIVGCALHLL